MTATIKYLPSTAFDPTDITITDDTSGALLIKEGSNEYMRINTTNGSEQMVLKGRPGSAASTGLWLTNQPFLQGGSAQFIQMVSSGINLETGQAGQRLDVRAGNSGNSFRVLGTGNAERFKVLDDSNATFTLDDSAGGIFKVQDDAGSPTEFLKIDSDTSASLIEFNVPANQGAGMTVNLPADSGSNTGFQVLVPGGSGSLKFGRQASGIYSGGTGFHLDVGAGKTFTFNGATFRFTTSTTPIVFNLNDASGGSLKITDAADAEIFKVEEDSSLTHTLDGASAATFKVVDDNASPKTYLSITESTQAFGADPYVHKVTLGDNNGYFNLGPNVLRANAMSGGATALYGPPSYLYNQSAVSVSTNQTYGDFDPCQTPYTMTMTAAATGNVTIDSGFTARGDYQSGASAKQSFPVLWVFQNDNATHNFILSFDGGVTGLEHTKSGDTDAAALISAGGLTLTPGQRYIVRFQKITNELLLIESVDKH